MAPVRVLALLLVSDPASWQGWVQGQGQGEEVQEKEEEEEGSLW